MTSDSLPPVEALQQTVDKAVGEVLYILRDQTDEARLQVISRLKDFYCLYCGRTQPSDPRGCQCWNDE